MDAGRMDRSHSQDTQVAVRSRILESAILSLPRRPTRAVFVPDIVRYSSVCVFLLFRTCSETLRSNFCLRSAVLT